MVDIEGGKMNCESGFDRNTRMMADAGVKSWIVDLGRTAPGTGKTKGLCPRCKFHGDCTNEDELDPPGRDRSGDWLDLASVFHCTDEWDAVVVRCNLFVDASKRTND